METNNLQVQIRKWADDTVEKYLQLIRSGWNYSFYTQSNLNDIQESPDYLILQMNPGGEGSYEEQISAVNWQLQGKDMDAEHFMRGNYCEIEKNGVTKPSWDWRDTWPNFRHLKSLFSNINGPNPLNDVSKFILTDASCFNTARAIDIYPILQETLPQMLKLVDVVQPKHIVVLGCKLATYIKQIDHDCKINPTPHERIKAGHIHHYETIFIDHLSAKTYTNVRTYKDDVKNFIRLWNDMPYADAISRAV